MAGANPTLTAITTEASRGGLFDRSNVANPVSGADVQGTIINDSTITLQFTINGEAQTPQSFTTNQAANTTLPFNFTIAGTGGGTGGAVVTGGTFDPVAGALRLTRSDNQPDITIPGFMFQQRTDEEINSLADTQIAATPISGLSNVDALGTAGQIASVSVDGMGISFIDPATAAVSANSFSSIDDTIVFTQRGNVVDLEARPAWEGNANTAPAGTTTVSGTNTVQVERLTLGADTGLVLVDNGAGAYTIQLAGTTPAPAGAPTATQPPATSALTPSPPQVITVTPTGGIFDTTGGADPVRPMVIPPTGTTPPTLMTAVNPGGGSATVTLSAGDSARTARTFRLSR